MKKSNLKKRSIFLRVFYLLGLVLFVSCQQNKSSIIEHKNAPETLKVYSQFDHLSPKFFNNSDTTYIVNFWATSCPPCIKEMPHFNALQEKSSDEKKKIILVSLDLERDLEKRVVPFVEKHQIKPEVALLGDQNYTVWTEKIDSSWMGALPATLVLNGSKRSFTFGAFESLEDIEEQISIVE